MIEALTGDSLERKVFFKKLQISQRKKSLLESLYNKKTLKGQEKENSSERKPEITCFMFHNSFLPEELYGREMAPSLLQKKKGESLKSDVSKFFFPDIGKTTNHF